MVHTDVLTAEGLTETAAAGMKNSDTPRSQIK